MPKGFDLVVNGIGQYWLFFGIILIVLFHSRKRRRRVSFALLFGLPPALLLARFYPWPYNFELPLFGGEFYQWWPLTSTIVLLVRHTGLVRALRVPIMFLPPLLLAWLTFSNVRHYVALPVIRYFAIGLFGAVVVMLWLHIFTDLPTPGGGQLALALLAMSLPAHLLSAFSASEDHLVYTHGYGLQPASDWVVLENRPSGLLVSDPRATGGSRFFPRRFLGAHLHPETTDRQNLEKSVPCRRAECDRIPQFTVLVDQRTIAGVAAHFFYYWWPLLSVAFILGRLSISIPFASLLEEAALLFVRHPAEKYVPKTKSGERVPPKIDPEKLAGTRPRPVPSFESWWSFLWTVPPAWISRLMTKRLERLSERLQAEINFMKKVRSYVFHHEKFDSERGSKE